MRRPKHSLGTLGLGFLMRKLSAKPNSLAANRLLLFLNSNLSVRRYNFYGKDF